MSKQEQKEFLYTKEDFERIRTILYQHSGIKLNDSKKEMVYTRLGRRLRATGLKTFKEYLIRVERDQGEEWEAFINSLTTNLTAFYREPHHFPILKEHVLSLSKRPIRLWCSASSTGEEPYTIAMTMVEAFGTFNPPVEIIATDIDTNVLSKAEAGIYPIERVEKLPRETLKRFFLKGSGNNNGYVQVRKELRELVSFRRLNLLDEHWPIGGGFDAIFCRNVMIYFDKPTQYKILKRFAPKLEANGLLFAGHSESLHHAADIFKLRGKTVYELASSVRHSKAALPSSHLHNSI
ncbi:CheR family methyltransferase [Methylomicrobium sp. RS1]|jgi:chemotaxis protein methyltransferase CheR|uniref:CheR family methyltransferase n=1 Tax=Candidatus Methylomicrobium oryzae TaxID=2802053 RepID=UPI001923A486|nr:CheR family methyltransferase [Methylomicrobium sp. RS1]MBL1265122.1 chemotaxis protein CheR [Methylomicrobium sp. RS1]